MTTRQSAKLGK